MFSERKRNIIVQNKIEIEQKKILKWNESFRTTKNKNIYFILNNRN